MNIDFVFRLEYRVHNICLFNDEAIRLKMSQYIA